MSASFVRDVLVADRRQQVLRYPVLAPGSRPSRGMPRHRGSVASSPGSPRRPAQARDVGKRAPGRPAQPVPSGSRETSARSRPTAGASGAGVHRRWSSGRVERTNGGLGDGRASGVPAVPSAARQASTAGGIWRGRQIWHGARCRRRSVRRRRAAGVSSRRREVALRCVAARQAGAAHRPRAAALRAQHALGDGDLLIPGGHVGGGANSPPPAACQVPGENCSPP